MQKMFLIGCVVLILCGCDTKKEERNTLRSELEGKLNLLAQVENKILDVEAIPANASAEVAEFNSYLARDEASVKENKDSLDTLVSGGLTWTKNNGTVASSIKGTANWGTANSTCTALTQDGFTWRLPTKAELSALYTAGTGPLTSAGWTLDYTWSSTDYGAGGHYFVGLYAGDVDGGNGRELGNYVSCVHGINVVKENKDSLDTLVSGGLTWTKNNGTVASSIKGTANWGTANSTCTALTQDGFTWRLPTKAELSALYTAGTGPLTSAGWTLFYTWSSTDGGAGLHYLVDLFTGVVGSDFDSGISYVSCVH